MGLLRKLLGGNKTIADTFNANLAALLESQNIDLIIDVGANQGQYARTMFSLDYHGSIISFEPGAVAHDLLSKKASGNSRWIIAPRMALGRKQEKLTLHTFDRTDMNSLLPPASNAFKSFPKLASTETEEVSVDRLDNVWKDLVAPHAKTKRNLLKIDTQGSDLAVFEGASACLDNIAMLQIEVPVVPIYEGSPAWMDVLQPIHQSGFRPVLAESGYFNKRLKGTIDMDIVFLRSGARL